MNYPLISIIVPVYQVEKYLEKCINSIIAQTYKNLEIILVDDGSTDSCPAICDRFKEEDSRIKIIHQENGGLSLARNVGLEHATGDFIGFVDSDDWIEPNMYEVLMSALQETGADIAVCDRQIETSDPKLISIDITSCERKLYSSEEALRMIINKERFIYSYVWNKLYKRTILANIQFLNNTIYEDILWTPQVVGNTKLLVCVDCPYYHYQSRAESLTHNNQNEVQRLLNKIEMYKKRLEYIHKYYPSLEKITVFKLQIFCFHEYMNINSNECHLDKDGIIQHELHKMFCQSGPINIQDIYSYKSKIGRILFRICPSLFRKIYFIIQYLSTKLIL